MIETAESPIIDDPDALAAYLCAAEGPELDARIQLMRPQFGLATVAALKRRVDALKLHNARMALQIAQITLRVAALADDPAAGALADWALGNAYYHHSDFSEALEAYRRAATYYQARNMAFERACVQINQVAVLQDMGDFAAALELAATAEDACRHMQYGAERLLAILEMNRGAVYQQLARPSEALAAYERGRRLLEQLGDPVESARIDINRANVLQEMGRFDQAVDLYRAARAALADADADQEVARAEHNLGKLAYRRGRYQEALQAFEAARAGFAAIPNPLEVAKTDLYRALVYRDLNLLDETIALADAAERALAHKHVRWDRAIALMVAGTARARLGDPAGAEPFLARARRVLRAQGAAERLPALDLERAALALAAGAPQRARRLAARAARRIDPALWPAPAARAAIVLAECELAGPRPQPRRSVRDADSALALATAYDLPEQADAYHVRARAYALAGDAAAARSDDWAALRAAESLRQRLPLDTLRLAYLEDRRAIYRAVLQRAMRDDTPALALAAVNLALNAPAPQPPVVPDDAVATQVLGLRERWAWLQHQIEGYDERHGSAEHGRAALDQERRTIETALADLAVRRDVQADTPHGVMPPADPLDPARAQRDLAAIQARLGPDDALLAFAAPAEQMDALLITHDQATAFVDLAELSGLRRLLRSWRFQIEHAYMATPEPTAAAAAHSHLRRFHNLLLAPLAAYLADRRRIFVCLPPEWHDLPIAAAHDGTTHLIERMLVSYLSAPSALPDPAAPIRPNGPALIVGYADQGRLPDAPAEALTVAALMREHGPLHLFVDDQAQMQALRAHLPTCGLLHLATHAAFRPDNPRFSWVRLADGRLTVADLAEVWLAGRPLVVLSACESGRGRPFGGGLAGMGRTLLLSGASALVVSLWRIADRSTLRLMSDLYRGAIADPAAALATAQRRAIAAGAHPFHWAAFICVAG